jgi:N-methylhydantoinase A/oxoprolinase/acetone carboxylase beta subunit
VANSYIRPNVATYLTNLQRAVKGSKLSILRSDGGEALGQDFGSRPCVDLLI